MPNTPTTSSLDAIKALGIISAGPAFALVLGAGFLLLGAGFFYLRSSFDD